MKKIENYINCLGVLQRADFEKAYNDEIYRMGVIGQFNLTFELSWKALQAVLRLHGVSEAETGSPREILKLGYKNGFVTDSETWLLMLNKRNVITHVYDDDEIDALIVMIRDSFVPAFQRLSEILIKKASEAENESL